jgi:hypothetical protein
VTHPLPRFHSPNIFYNTRSVARLSLTQGPAKTDKDLSDCQKATVAKRRELVGADESQWGLRRPKELIRFPGTHAVDSPHRQIALKRGALRHCVTAHCTLFSLHAH